MLKVGWEDLIIFWLYYPFPEISLLVESSFKRQLSNFLKEIKKIMISLSLFFPFLLGVGYNGS